MKKSVVITPLKNIVLSKPGKTPTLQKSLRHQLSWKESINRKKVSQDVGEDAFE